MPGLPLDHIAIATPALEEAIPLYERLLGEPASPIEHLAEQGVRAAFIGTLELVEPTAPETPVGRFLARRSPGLHHIAYRTSDITAELERLAAEGFEAIDRAPRSGARGHRVAFLHPRSTGGVLIELVELPP